MNKKRKITLCILACALVCAASFGVTYSYLISSDSVSNSFVVGDTKIIVRENYEPPAMLEPGISFKKEPFVINDGNLTCFVRLRVDFSRDDAADLCVLDINNDTWSYNDNDGYYYYKLPLEPGEQTQPIFTTVTIKTADSSGNSLQVSDMLDFDIIVYGEANQHLDHDGDCPTDEYSSVHWEYGG